MAEGFEEREGGVQVHLHAEVEVGLRAGRHDAVEDVDGVEGEGCGEQGVEGGGVAKVGFDGVGVGGVHGFGGDGRLDDVGEDELGLGVAEEALGEELAYEASCSCNENSGHVGGIKR